MPKSANHKLKLLYLMKIFLEYSDEDHPLTVADLATHLAGYGITAERKSLYSDIEMLREFGLDIETVEGRAHGHYVASRDFELPELKLLVDAVQSSKFITQKKSRELIKKIEGFASKYQATGLERQVFVANRIKTMNESIYYTVDYIHTAISNDSQICFKYFEWTSDKQKRLKHGGKDYILSPWSLTWDDENYYLVAYDSDCGEIRHYRVDKMLNISLTDEKRDGRQVFSDFDMAVYSRKTFGMYGGNEERVTLRCKNHLAGVIIDRFGMDTVFFNSTEETFEINIQVAVSPMFLSWVMNFGSEMKVLSPKSVQDKIANQANEIIKQYKQKTALRRFSYLQSYHCCSIFFIFYPVP